MSAKEKAQGASTELTQDSEGAAPEAEVIVAEKAAPKVVEEKMVTVKSKITGRKFIGGWVELVKDKETQVTRDQRRSLQDAGAIYL